MIAAARRGLGRHPACAGAGARTSTRCGGWRGRVSTVIDSAAGNGGTISSAPAPACCWPRTTKAWPVRCCCCTGPIAEPHASTRSQSPRGRGGAVWGAACSMPRAGRRSPIGARSCASRSATTTSRRNVCTRPPASGVSDGFRATTPTAVLHSVGACRWRRRRLAMQRPLVYASRPSRGAVRRAPSRQVSPPMPARPSTRESRRWLQLVRSGSLPPCWS